MTFENYFQNLNITSINENLLNKDVVCMTKENFATAFKDLCIQASTTRPIIFISVAIFLDIVEYYLRNFIYIDSHIGIFSLKNFIVFISTLKTMFLVLALVMLIFGVNAWG